jgi:hypothetical protein
MKSKFSKMIPAMAVLLLFVLLGGPQLAIAQSAQQTPSTQPQDAPPASQATEQSGTTQSPAALPEAPQAQQPVGTPALPRDAQPQQEQAPVGAAAAQKGVTAGGAASKPAGNAIAPAKQRQVRSVLIKIGLIAAGGAAIGTVYALSRGTSSTPPGSGR